MFLFFVFFFERTRPAASMRPHFLIYLSTSIGVRTGCYHLIGLSVCVCACVTLNSSFLPIARVVRRRFPQTRYLSNPVSMEARLNRLTRGTCFAARRPEVVAVAGMLRLCWCVPGGVDFFVLSMSLHSQIQS